MARNDTDQSNTPLRRNRSDHNLQPGDDELIERQLQHLQQQNLLEQQAILTQKLRSTAALVGAKQHVVGGGRGYGKVTSSKALSRGHGSSTKLNRRPSSRPSSRPTSRASSPDRIRAASYTASSSSAVPTDDPPPTNHRRSTSDIRPSRNSSSSNLKKNSSGTSLKKNRSHTDINKKTRSEPIIKRTPSDRDPDNVRPGKHQVHFDLGSDEDEDEAGDQDGDEGEWVDASSSASPVLSRQGTAANSRGGSGQPSQISSPVLQTRGLPTQAPPAAAAAAAVGPPPAGTEPAGEVKAAPSVDKSQPTAQLEGPTQRPQHNRATSSRVSAGVTQKDSEMASTVAPAVREGLPLPRRPSGQRQQTLPLERDRETSIAATPPTERRAPHRLMRGETGSTLVATTGQADSQAGGLTSRFIGDGSQPSQDGNSGSFYGQETGAGRRGSRLGDAMASNLARRPRSTGDLQQGEESLADTGTDQHEEKALTALQADPRLRHVARSAGGAPSTSAPDVGGGGGITSGSPGGIASHGGLGGGFGDSRIQLKLNLAREHPEDDENRIVSAARLATAASASASATTSTSAPSASGMQAPPGFGGGDALGGVPYIHPLGMGEYYGGRGYPLADADSMFGPGRRPSRGGIPGGGGAPYRDNSNSRDMMRGVGPDGRDRDPRGGITAIIESYKGASPLYGGDGGGLGGLGGIPIGIGVGVPGGGGESGLLLPGDGMGGMHHQYGGGLGLHGGGAGVYNHASQFQQGGLGVQLQKNKRGDVAGADPVGPSAAAGAPSASGLGLGLGGSSRARGKRDPRITRELEGGGREYLVVRRYQNPVARSAARIRDANRGKGQPIPGSNDKGRDGAAAAATSGSAGSTTTGHAATNTNPTPSSSRQTAAATSAGGSGRRPTTPGGYQNGVGGGGLAVEARPSSSSVRLPPSGPGRTFEEETAPSAGIRHHAHHRPPVLQMRSSGRGGGGGGGAVRTSRPGPHDAAAGDNSLSGSSLVEDGDEDEDEEERVEGDDERGTLATLRMLWEKSLDLSASQD